MYRCVATTPTGFIQQLAVCYLRHGYWFFVRGEVPGHKDPSLVDEKLLCRYRVDLSKWARTRRKQAGLANVHYLRHGRFFVLLATHGRHEIITAEAGVIRDARRTPIRFGGYAVSYRGGHPHVRIDREPYLELKAALVDMATWGSSAEVFAAFRRVEFEPYAPVRRQLLTIWRAVNATREAAGLEPVPVECIRMRRRIVRPFGDDLASEADRPASGEAAPAERVMSAERPGGGDEPAGAEVEHVRPDEAGLTEAMPGEHAARDEDGERGVEREEEHVAPGASGEGIAPGME